MPSKALQWLSCQLALCMPAYGRPGSVRCGVQEYALWLLWQSTDLASRRSVARACCAHDIINVMVSRQLSTVAQEHAAAVLSSVTSEVAGVDDAVRAENQSAVVRSGGVQPLVKLLSVGNAGAKRHAACALAQLAEGTDGAVQAAQLEIAAEGAITQLVRWLYDPSIGPLAVAARALASIGKGNRDTQCTITEEGAIEPLVAVLRRPDPSTALETAPILPTRLEPALVMPPPAAGTGAALWAKVKNAQRATSAFSKAGFTAAGSTSRGSDAGGTAAIAVAASSSSSSSQLSPPPLPGSAQARLDDAVARRWAAGAIATVAEQNSLNQIRVAEEGGLGPLVELLKRPALALPQETSRTSAAAPISSWDAPTRALWHLAADADNQLGIARAGGLPPLVRVLSEGNEQARQWAAAALEALSRDCTENQLALARSASDAIAPLVRAAADRTQITAPSDAAPPLAPLTVRPCSPECRCCCLGVTRRRRSAMRWAHGSTLQRRAMPTGTRWSSRL